MGQTELLSFEDFCELLLPLGTVNSPSELHGYLSGKLCGGKILTKDQWLKAAWDLLDTAEQPNPEAHDQVLNLQRTTQQQLQSGDYDLQLLLPDDDSDIEERLLALSQWCHGFLSGFGSAGIDPNTQFSSDQADALRDLAAIVQVTSDEDESQQEQEHNYSELVEYVRVVALNFYQDNGPENNAPNNNDIISSPHKLH